MTINLRQRVLILCQLFWALAIHSFTACPAHKRISREYPSDVQHLTKLEAVPPTSFGSVLQQTNPNIFQENSAPTKTKSVQKWRCEVCACGFDKLKNYNEHLQGKKHKAVMAQADDIWREYRNSGPTFYATTVTKEVVTAVWSLDAFMEGLQARSRSSFKRVMTSNDVTNSGGIDPNIHIEDLSPDKRAMFWRHLHSYNVATMLSALPPKYARVKEILESLEVFHHIEMLLRRSTAHGQKVKRVETIYDVGCGHGLVGMLCAVAYPHITVRSIDIVPRESFQAQRSAFETSSGSALDNLQFMNGDLSVLEDNIDAHENSSNNNNTLLLCVHGCKSLTHESIELALSNHWAWLSLPCCLQADNHMDANLKVDDDTRFSLLCGAIAAKYKADTISSIDRRITGRGIVISSSGN